MTSRRVTIQMKVNEQYKVLSFDSAEKKTHLSKQHSVTMSDIASFAEERYEELDRVSPTNV